MAVDLSSVGTGAANIGIIIVVALVALGFVAAFFYLLSWRKKWQQFKVIVWGKDSFGQVYEEYDRAGIFVDKVTGNKRFFLQKNKLGLNPDNVPYVVDKKGKKMVYLLKTGLKNFFYLQPRLNTDGKITFQVGEEDVNWAVNAFERQKKLFGENKLLQYMPFIALAFVSIIILIIFIYFFKNFGVLKDVALAFKDSATAFAQSASGTVVLPS